MATKSKASSPKKTSLKTKQSVTKKTATKAKQQKNSWLSKFIYPGNWKLWAGVFVLVFGLGGVLFTLLSHAYTATEWNTYANGLRQCESGNNYSINTGNGYYGAYQFSHTTWASVGGTAYSNNANGSSKNIQDYFAYKLYKSRGFQPWSCWTQNISPTRTAWWGNPNHYSSTGSLPGASTPTPSVASLTYTQCHNRGRTWLSPGCQTGQTSCNTQGSGTWTLGKVYGYCSYAVSKSLSSTTCASKHRVYLSDPGGCARHWKGTSGQRFANATQCSGTVYTTYVLATSTGIDWCATPTASESL